jgi:uncharacterized integral membrane protein
MYPAFIYSLKANWLVSSFLNYFKNFKHAYKIIILAILSTLLMLVFYLQNLYQLKIIAGLKSDSRTITKLY